MATKIELYERLREHIPTEAARLIAEEMTTETHLAAKIDALAAATKADIESLRAGMFRSMLFFFLPLWIGVYATLVAILLRGTP